MRLLVVLLAPLSLCALPACNTQVSVAGGGSQPVSARFAVVGVDPEPGRIEVGPSRVLRVELSEPIDLAASGPSPLLVQRLPDLAVASGRIDLEDASPGAGESPDSALNRVLVFVPDPPLAAGTAYRLSVSPAVTSAEGDVLGAVVETEDGTGLPAVYETYASPPALGAEFAARAASSAAIEASWSAASDDVTPAAGIVYEIFAVVSTQAFDLSRPALRTPPGALAALIAGLEPGTEYRLALRALDGVGNSSALSVALTVATDVVVDTDAPVFSGIVSLEARSPTEILASWSAAADDVDPPELLRYNVYLALDPGAQDFAGPCLSSAPALCQSSAPGALELVVGGLSPDTTYHAVVRAADTSGNESRNLEELEATTLVSFSAQFLPILTHPQRGCTISTNCHRGATPRDGLNLESYAGLMRGGISSQTGVRPPVIVPFEEIDNDMQSYFLWRTDTTNLNFEGPSMPLGRTPLTAAQLDLIKRWIHQGALDN